MEWQWQKDLHFLKSEQMTRHCICFWKGFLTRLWTFQYLLINIQKVKRHCKYTYLIAYDMWLFLLEATVPKVNPTLLPKLEVAATYKRTVDIWQECFFPCWKRRGDFIYIFKYSKYFKTHHHYYTQT